MPRGFFFLFFIELSFRGEAVGINDTTGYEGCSGMRTLKTAKISPRPRRLHPRNRRQGRRRPLRNRGSNHREHPACGLLGRSRKSLHSLGNRALECFLYLLVGPAHISTNIISLAWIPRCEGLKALNWNYTSGPVPPEAVNESL